MPLDPIYTMTPPRRAWLQRLVESPGISDEGRPVTDCMILRWCARAFLPKRCDLRMTVESLYVVFGEDWRDHTGREHDAGIVITRWGREALKGRPDAR